MGRRNIQARAIIQELNSDVKIKLDNRADNKEIVDFIIMTINKKLKDDKYRKILWD